MHESNVTKGARVRVSFFRINPNAALSGAQMKFAAEQVGFTGVVRHLRVDRPVNPTIVRAYVDPDAGQSCAGPTVRPPGCQCANEHIEIDPKHIVEVL